ncbi:capsular biosynthesis protein [Bacillus pseudomycoides]|uniref:Capsular biosynthesis protein n=1 Tax=Bacillus pseudomycoides TaxID=64104 RepID=A0AA91ZSH4_9BACI|nr:MULTISPECIES: EpsG family protein [Bacillus]PEB56271.1 capsular biosynthesis protein [Bacillus sp. AFS098217]PED81701.1 capsular biosynthesis protein [Bacillus pseudomycoides]PEU09350.1 capsular biosynthesis protein [Bacillus sp. AFS014408]PEU10629.1 capsular biosynthesis protein [Bacillus sp. AFS019443]PFW64244.1 capsular biosynthesis protein [Bacillus sp. AFS075034]
MNILWMNLAIVFILSFFARYFAMPVNTGPTLIKPNQLLVLIAALTLVLVAGLRDNIGDTYFYMHAYTVTDFNWEYIQNNKDMGFNIFQMILQEYTDDPQVMIFITALITNILIVFILYKYSRLIDLSLYVYITSGMYLTSMNGIRQYLAAAIIFAATTYILDGNWKKYTIIILFASTFHQSALVLIPIYFLIRRKAWSATTFILLFLAVLIVIGFNQFSEVFFAAIGDTQYGHYKDFHEGGANILRVAVDAAPLILAYLGREKLRELFPKSDYIVNMALLGCVFMIISTQNWIFARFSIYFGLYQLILIPWVVKLFTEKDQKFVYYAILVCYFVYFVYEHVITLGIIYKSNFL